MRILSPRAAAVSLLILSFLTQSTGAADIALMLGPAARPAAFPPAALAPKPPAALLIRPVPPGIPLSIRLGAALRSFAQGAQAVWFWLDDYLQESEAAPAPAPGAW